MSVDQPGHEPPRTADLTTLLQAWRGGDDGAFDVAIERVYDELRRMAAQRVESNDGATLSPTELVHEAVLGILPARAGFANRAHFLATMSLAMRAILVDHARARRAEKRGGDRMQVSIYHIDAEQQCEAAVDMLVLEQALCQLEALDARCGQVMHLTYFGGLSQEEIAELLSVSIPTVKRDLRFARAWLSKALGDGDGLPRATVNAD